MTLIQPIINDKWRCITAKPWKSEVVGFVDKVLTNSCIIRIMITNQCDDHLIDEYHGKIVVSKKANEFFCTINCWAMIAPRFLCPTMGEFLECRHAEGDGTLDLAYLVYNYLNINTEHLWFGTAERKWVVYF